MDNKIVEAFLELLKVPTLRIAEIGASLDSSLDDPRYVHQEAVKITLVLDDPISNERELLNGLNKLAEQSGLKRRG